MDACATNNIIKNRVLLGSNPTILKEQQSECVDLCYIDPPFFSGSHYSTVDHKTKTLTSFNDDVCWNRDIDTYLTFMRSVFLQIYRILKKEGSFYIQCDHHAVFELKVLLDKIFGRKCFKTVLVWPRMHGAHNNIKRAYGSKLDFILYYTKHPMRFTFNPIYLPVKGRESGEDPGYTCFEKETGRKYRHSPTIAVCMRVSPELYFTFHGVTQYWRHSRATLEKYYESGKLVLNPVENRAYIKTYLDEMPPGCILQNLWNDHDVSPMVSTSPERVWYPTQKPIGLIKRIINVSSNPGDMVMDCFCGSGTTGVAAVLTGRNYLLIDENPEAIELTKKRLTRTEEQQQRQQIEKDISVQKPVAPTLLSYV